MFNLSARKSEYENVNDKIQNQGKNTNLQLGLIFSPFSPLWNITMLMLMNSVMVGVDFGVAGRILLSFFPPFPDQLSPIDFFLPFDKMAYPNLHWPEKILK